jgi:hypothetical protein
MIGPGANDPPFSIFFRCRGTSPVPGGTYIRTNGPQSLEVRPPVPPIFFGKLSNMIGPGAYDPPFSIFFAAEVRTSPVPGGTSPSPQRYVGPQSTSTSPVPGGTYLPSPQSPEVSTYYVHTYERCLSPQFESQSKDGCRNAPYVVITQCRSMDGCTLHIVNFSL